MSEKDSNELVKEAVETGKKIVGFKDIEEIEEEITKNIGSVEKTTDDLTK